MLIIQDYIIGLFQHCLKCQRKWKYLEIENYFHKYWFLKLLYPDKDEWNNSFLVELNSIVEEYEHDISLKHIGFPQDWYVQLVK